MTLHGGHRGSLNNRPNQLPRDRLRNEEIWAITHRDLTSTLSPETLLKAITTSLDDNKAEEIAVIPLADKSSIADYMVIASGFSQRHVASAADHLLQNLKKLGVNNVRSEGLTVGDWVLIDTGDVVVHLMRPEVRAFYGLERLWGPGGSLSVAG